MSSNPSDATKRMAKQESELIDHMKVSAAGGAVAGGGGVPPLAGGKGYQSTQNIRQPVGSDFARLPPSPSAEGAQRSNENLRRALRISESTNATGYATIHSLGRQRDTMQSTLESVEVTQGNLLESQAVIRNIRMGIYKEWLVKACVIVALVGLIVLIFWSKFIRK
ncbi:unnamed protein product [Phytomonas sp. EM1]|nr:unnamed protein product [Phytomonas sp. EM1]|eukprot:CCW65501.1 unnamed protein product [Phytomonas sp. isolate EM1]